MGGDADCGRRRVALNAACSSKAIWIRCCVLFHRGVVQSEQVIVRDPYRGFCNIKSNCLLQNPLMKRPAHLRRWLCGQAVEPERLASNRALGGASYELSF